MMAQPTYSYRGADLDQLDIGHIVANSDQDRLVRSCLLCGGYDPSHGLRYSGFARG